MADTDAATVPQTAAITGPQDLIGRFVIARCRDAGVHAGTLGGLNGERGATLQASRRLWSWHAASGAFLSGVAVAGLKPKVCKIGATVDIVLTEVCELIPCTEEAAASIAGYPTHEPR